MEKYFSKDQRKILKIIVNKFVFLHVPSTSVTAQYNKEKDLKFYVGRCKFIIVQNCSLTINYISIYIFIIRNHK